MARPKNIEGRSEIRRAAFELFMQQGYAATTYADIAAAVNRERTSVQGFFPKKELLAIDFMNSIVHGNEQFARDEGLLTGDPTADFYVIGQLNISFHVKDRGMRLFTQDALGDRSLMLGTLTYNEEWVERFMDVPGAKRTEVMENYMVAQGGGNELLYKLLASGASVDVHALVGKIIVAFNSLMDIPLGDAPDALADDVVERSNGFLVGYLLA